MRPDCPNKPAGGWPVKGGGKPGGGGDQQARGGNFGKNNNGKRGRPYGKLNCTTMEEICNSDKAVIGTLSILTHPGKVLFDTGATTSFISKQFIDKFGIRCLTLDNPITVISAGGTLLVTHIK
jgi:hypothetical protein